MTRQVQRHAQTGGTQTASETTTIIFLVGLVLAALAVLETLVFFPFLTASGNSAAATSIGTMTVVVIAIYQAVVALGYQPTLLNVFLCISVFTATCDLGITGNLVGVWELGGFYPQHGEKYFATAYGVACLGWDGVFHTLIQAYLAFRALRGLSLKPAGLIWAGSVINSMMPLLLGGAASGKFSAHVEFSTTMNAPYVLIPIVLAFHLFNSKAVPRVPEQLPLAALPLDLVGSEAGPDVSVSRGARVAPPRSFALDVFLALSHAALVVVHTVQTMVVFGSKAGVAGRWVSMVEPILKEDDTNVLLVQCAQYFFYFNLFHCVAVWEIGHRLHCGKRSVLANGSDWAALALGGYLQGLFTSSYMAMAKYHAPGQIEYDFVNAGPTTALALFIVLVSAIQTWSFIDTDERSGMAKHD